VIRQYNQKYLQGIILFVSGMFSISGITALSNPPQADAFEGTSTQTSCIDDQPCHTMVCSEGQPCRASETPNTDYEFETDNTFSLHPGSMPFPDPYNSDYLDDQEEYLEDQQDMIEDAEFE
jgi:hypothetical protein